MTSIKLLCIQMSTPPLSICVALLVLDRLVVLKVTPVFRQYISNTLPNVYKLCHFNLTTSPLYLVKLKIAQKQPTAYCII